MTVGVDREGVVIRLSGSYLFDSGRAELKPNSLAVLDAIAERARPLTRTRSAIDGHTDSTPIESARYPTNWELSAARALAVTRYLTETDGVRSDRLMAAGFGEFRPLVPNDTREHRAQNRRVEIHLLSSVAGRPWQLARSRHRNSIHYGAPRTMIKIIAIIGVALLARRTGRRGHRHGHHPAAVRARRRGARRAGKGQATRHRDVLTKERVVNLTDKAASKYLKVPLTLEFIDSKAKDPPKGAAVLAAADRVRRGDEPATAPSSKTRW